MPKPLQEAFFIEASDSVARNLIGATLNYHGQRAIILETEAYQGNNDPASHAFKGRTQRNDIMFQKPGLIYVYLIYGMHLCLNVTTSAQGIPGSVFIRAIQLNNQIINGPGRLTSALGIKLNDTGRDVTSDPEVFFSYVVSDDDHQIVALPRVGISHGKDKLWRFKSIRC
tara:strand:- start:15 stop:524 length:510 start_codon:yes stop_codon:yes gene_type:complete